MNYELKIFLKILFLKPLRLSLSLINLGKELKGKGDWAKSRVLTASRLARSLARSQPTESPTGKKNMRVELNLKSKAGNTKIIHQKLSGEYGV